LAAERPFSRISSGFESHYSNCQKKHGVPAFIAWAGGSIPQVGSSGGCLSGKNPWEKVDVYPGDCWAVRKAYHLYVVQNGNHLIHLPR
jgi:hypothetical protein